MSRAFYAEVAECLPGFLPRARRSFRHRIGFAGMKVWYASAHEHFEVQRIPAAVLRAAGVQELSAALEIGFHAEHPRGQDNDAALARLVSEERAWRPALGREVEAGAFVGKREQASRWRRVSELWDASDLDPDGAPVEAADRLARYIVALAPLLEREPAGRCPCWAG